MKNFGFGCMRLPMLENGEVDEKEMCKMVDTFLENGFTYFDTAHLYLEGKSEPALRACLTSRYPREKYLLADKLSGGTFEKEEDIPVVFQEQLEACGVEYFDYYLMHALGRHNYPKYEECHAFEFAKKMKEEGKIKHLAMSFHDSADYLDMILTNHPEVEAVQIQFNYADYNSKSIQSKQVYEVCRKHNKPVIIMEPVKGGTLVNLTEEGNAIFDKNRSGSNASYAVRFAASFEGVFMVLSGMSNLEQMQDNISFMKDFVPLSEEEKEMCLEVANTFAKNRIACTNCRYCVKGCPKQIPIPDAFAALNEKRAFGGWNAKSYYKGLIADKGAASDCIKCGLCERTCPQMLPIRKYLEEVAAEFGK